MFQPGLVLEPGLKFSVGATSTQNLENPAPVEDNIVEEVAYGGSSASFKPAPPTTYEHFAALANLDAIKEEEMSYRCFSPFSIGSSMIFSADTEEKSINKPGSSVGVKEGWAKENALPLALPRPKAPIKKTSSGRTNAARRMTTVRCILPL
jgi:hypothetical protein